MDQNGTIYLTEADNDNLLVDTSNCTIQKKENDIKNYFCVMDKAYSIPGKNASSEGLFLVEVYEDYDNRNLVDTISGKVLLEGYEDFSAITIDETTYVYAEKGETVEIYQISLKK